MPPKKYFKKTNIKNSTKDYSDITREHSDAIYLIIVESPSKCAKIESYLGSNYKCIASKGHIRSIDGMKNIDRKKNYAINFSIIDEKKSHVEYMRNCIGSFSKENVILATDDDREGEAIAWHICMLFELPIETTKRILFHEITKPALQKAIQHPTIVDIDLVYAQHARQVLDILVGYKISPFLWKHIHNNKTNGLSAGRCQTPALRLVYENDREVVNGEIDTKYKTTGTFFNKNIVFHLEKDFLDISEMKEFLELSKTFRHMLSIGKTSESIKKPPKPFNTSALLQTASNVLHMSPKETMNCCQQLYQAGHITYMRTENTKYSVDFLPKVRDYILDKWNKEEYLGNFENIVNKDETNPHEAIRVTHIEHPFILGLDGRLHTLYKLIWRNTIESCMASARYNCTPISISSPKDTQYKHTIEVPLFLGWKIVGDKENAISPSVDEQNTGSGLLFFLKSLNTTIPVIYNKIESIVTVTHRHSHYTESSLIQKLEDLGIGRPSTFATIVDTIQERGYVKKKDIEGITIDCNDFILREHTLEENINSRVFGKEKNKLVLQPIGLVTVEFLIQHFHDLFQYDYTKQMEDGLDKISVDNWYNICSDCENLIKTLSKPVSKLSKPVYLVKSRDETKQYELCFHQYGTSLKHVLESGDVEYKKVNPKIKIDIELAKTGKYIAEDLMEIPNDYLGKYNEEDVFIKTGKYGPYVQIGEKTISVKSLGKPISEINFTDVLEIIDPSTKVNSDEDDTTSGNQLRGLPKNPSILRILNSDISIRKGKYGPYIFYMPAGKKKPEFFTIGKYKSKYANTDATELIKWIGETYNV